jgi:hypothetical protein
MPPADPNRFFDRRQHSSPSPSGNGGRPPLGPDAIAAAIRAALAARGPGKTLCPSEIARALVREESAWRALMPEIRAVAARLAAAGELVVSQRGRPVDPATARGPIRLALAPVRAGRRDPATP